MNLNFTMIGQTITFFIFVWFCLKYIWPPLKAAMAERQKLIAEGLSAAERAEKDLELAQERATDQMREAKQEAAGILDQARQRATVMIEEAKNDARSEGDRLVEAAQAEIEQEMNRAKEALRTQVAALVVSGAERVLQSSVDEAKHAQLLTSLAAEL